MVKVELFLKDGTVLKQTVEAPRGSEREFPTEDEVVDKFEKLTKNVMQAHQLESIVDAVLHLEKLPDVSTLARALQKQ